jgi:signal transduction histidine kinase
MIQTNSTPISAGYQRFITMAGYAVIVMVAVRTINNSFLAGVYNVIPSVVLLSSILLLYATASFLSRRFALYPYPYTLLYTILALALGLQLPHFDMWGILFFPLSFQVVRFFPPRIAIAWLVIHAAVVVLELTLTLGLAGFTTSLNMIAGGVGLISSNALYIQTELARRNSQKLLTDLQDAHNKLLVYTRSVEELAVIQERNRLARELHDMVNQELFSITLNAQSARLLVDKDPSRVPGQLEQLQIMTSHTLASLRSLITQLRPPVA